MKTLTQAKSNHYYYSRQSNGFRWVTWLYAGVWHVQAQKQITGDGKAYYRYVGGRLAFNSREEVEAFVVSHSAEFHNIYAAVTA